MSLPRIIPRFMTLFLKEPIVEVFESTTSIEAIEVLIKFIVVFF